ncbi:hypothetical protein ACFV1N_20525 [Streptosporangium canum]|uniref:hypothetical protein n=1 Tax=Streptosporangium canum TaxID=324952 RepID=UPI0036C0DC21
MIDLLPAALKGFAVLAQHTSDLADGAFRAYTVDDWPSPSFSPIIHLGLAPPQPGELDAVRTYWHHQWGPQVPACLLVPVAGASPAPLPGGWHAEPRPLHVIVETPAPAEVDLDSAFTLSVTPLGDPATEAAFLRLVTVCFPDTRTAPELVMSQLRQADARTELITITRPASSEPVATSALSVKDDTCIQTWGAVPEPYRGLRLSRTLQQAASRRCRELGATTTVTVTRNPRVIGPGRPHLNLWIYRTAPTQETDR